MTAVPLLESITREMLTFLEERGARPTRIDMTCDVFKTFRIEMDRMGWRQMRNGDPAFRFLDVPVAMTPVGSLDAPGWQFRVD